MLIQSSYGDGWRPYLDDKKKKKRRKRADNEDDAETDQKADSTSDEPDKYQGRLVLLSKKELDLPKDESTGTVLSDPNDNKFDDWFDTEALHLFHCFHRFFEREKCSAEKINRRAQ